jgi:PAP2 superfamily
VREWGQPIVLSSRRIWSVILVVLAADAVWLGATEISADHTGVEQLLAAIGFLIAVALFYYSTGRSDRLMRVANSTAQLISFSAAAAALSYLVMTTGAPLVDTALANADRALGFEWRSLFAWVRAHRMIHVALAVAYTSLLYQMVACVVFLAMTGSADEFLSMFILSALVTIAVSGLLPAAGNLPDAPHMPHFAALRDGTLHAIPLGRLAQGLIAFPSFHTTLAIIITCAVRKTRWLFAALCVLNSLMILSIPTEGGHYLVDVLGGVAVAALAMWAMRSRPEGSARVARRP